MTLLRLMACAAVLAGSVVAASEPRPLPDALTTHAIASTRAAGTAMLALAYAGKRVVAAGERGIVQWSDDGGAHWTQAAVPVQVSLTGLRFADDRVGYAVGHLGVILKTVDGGANWQLKLDGQRAASLMAEALRAAGQDKEAARHAVEGPDKPFFDVEVLDAQRALAVGAYNLAFLTEDGGAHWRPVSTLLPNPRGLHLYCVRLQGSSLFVAGEQGLLMRSNDGGKSFESLPTPYKGSFFGLLPMRPRGLMAFGLRGNAYRSLDDGQTWDKAETSSSASLNAGLQFTDGTLALLAQTGDVLLSRDGGLHFTLHPGDGIPAASFVAVGSRQLLIASLRGPRRASPTP